MLQIFNPVKRVFLTLAIFVFGLIFIAINHQVKAQVNSYSYDKISANITINSDSTVDVTEEYVYRFNGLYHAATRDITLIDVNNQALCKKDSSLQCGGFEFLEISAVYNDQGNELKRLPQDQYRYDSAGHVLAPVDSYTQELIDNGSQKQIRIQWLFSEAGRNFNNETLKFSVKYRVYGSIGYFPKDNYDLFYWNAIAETRGGLAKNVEIHVNYPVDIQLKQTDFKIISTTGFPYQWQYDNKKASLLVTGENLPADQGITVLSRIPQGIVSGYGTINLKLFPAKQNVSFQDVENYEVTNKISGLPPGKYQLKFSASGWNSVTKEVTVKANETQDLTVNLKPDLFTIIIIISVITCNLLGCLLLPIASIWYLNVYLRRGRDQNKIATVVPLFKPPVNVRPYLLGSIKDEQVDMVDITATLIDLAYRGYLKIREFGAKSVLGIQIKAQDFELIKVKDFDDLNESEQKIIKSIFDGKDRVSTTSLKNHFYLSIPGIKDKIYTEMVTLGYFGKRPDKVRAKYLTIGILMFCLGLALIFVNFVLPLAIGLAIAIIILGIIVAATSKYMPAKTTLGSKIFNEILGFKMYMETAERFRVQNLTPETFEKFLAYAIVFGIEEKWADKFKDIYKTPPDWYEGSNISTWNALYLAHALSSFRSTTSQAMQSTPSSSGNSFSGGGWSGGGGFSGGFSGGGGGGGGSGAW
ncbi:MAG: DUF2207 domain-containing protein [bacterium]